MDRTARFARLVLLALFAVLPFTLAASVPAGFIVYTQLDGTEILLPTDRQPSLFSGNYGSCLETNYVDITRFDAAMYKDNMTVIFDIEGNTNLSGSDIIVYIGVYAYGETRFEVSFNPCLTGIVSMCPIQSNVTMKAHGTIPLGQTDIDGIPDIAFSIPDFEGQAILRIFSNTTQSEISCYSAIVTNGATFSHPAAVGTILGIFALVAMVASFVTSIYGSDVPTMRTHYAHSLSVLVVFAVYQHIFFTGALSMNWPSVLVAFWSNYAWSAGMIYTNSMQNAIDRLTAGHRGNTTSLGAAGSGTWASDVGGGFNIHSLYKRSMIESFAKRAESLGSDSLPATQYMGHVIRDGLPLPGNYSGFPGTLSPEAIPVSNAFLTYLLWLLILLVIVAASVPLTKLILDVLCKRRILKTERLHFFRTHWIGYTVAALLRTCYIAFFSVMFFTIFQFSYGGVAAVEAIAAIVFLIFLVGVPSIVAYAVWYRLKMTDSHIEATMHWHVVPGFRIQENNPTVEGGVGDANETKNESVDDLKIGTPDERTQGAMDFKPSKQASLGTSIHDDVHYTTRFGWLVSRFRKSKWWFFAVWMVYEFLRACFLAAPADYAMVQVFGLLGIEFIAFVLIISIRPFEGQRLNIVMVYLLGFSKFTTVALSAAFDINFKLPRITTTVIGVVIIVIQGILTIVLMVCVVISAITSYYSVMRYRDSIRPKRWNTSRRKYLAYLEKAPRDRPMTPPPRREPTPEPEEPKEPYFAVSSVRRAPKIEDEDAEFQSEIALDPRLSDPRLSGMLSNNFGTMSNLRLSQDELPGSRTSRAMSSTSRLSNINLPYGARLHRGSWSTKDFSEFNGASSGLLAGEAVTTTPIGDNEGMRPSSRQYSQHMHGPSRDSIDGQSMSGYTYNYAPVRSTTANHARNASALSTSANAYSDPTEPELDNMPMHSTPFLSDNSTSHLYSGRQSSLDTPDQTMDLTGRTLVPDDNTRPMPPAINTTLANVIGRDDHSPSPRSPRSPRQGRLQKHRARESIDEGYENN